MINFTLFLQFFKFGAMCFGGGYMIIPLLFQQYVEKDNLFSLTEFGNLLSISQLTPGAVSMNTATYVGFLRNTWSGALTATVALALPTVLIAFIALTCIKKFENSCFVKGVLQGGRWAALVMLGYAAVLFMGMSIFTAPLPIMQTKEFLLSGHWENPDNFGINYSGLCVFLLSLILMTKTKLSMTSIIITAGVVGLISSVALAGTIDDTPFYPDSCLNGTATGWTNACECYQGFSGALCTEESLTSCTGLSCPANQYCNNGFCHDLTHYSPIITDKGTFLLSRSLMTYSEAQEFCRKLSAKMVTRADFDCHGTGAGCLNTILLNKIQQTTRLRGFIWLDSHSNKTDAYYADLNDGVIYQSNKNNRKYTQALCLLKEFK